MVCMQGGQGNRTTRIWAARDGALRGNGRGRGHAKDDAHGRAVCKRAGSILLWLLFQNTQFGGRSIGLAYVLWFILGQLSLHRFYCGQKDSAFMQLGLVFGSLVVMFIFPIFGFVGFGVWICWLFGDLFMIPGMLRKFQAEHDYRSVFN